MYNCTVAIPVFNRKDMIDKTLNSVLEQDCQSLEILVIDDCSVDGVWEKLMVYRDSRLRLVRNETNIGLFANFNKCLLLSRGKFIRILCNDDILTPGCLKRECDFMDLNPTVVLLNKAGKLVSNTGKMLGHSGRDIPEGIYEGHKAIRIFLKQKALYRNPLSCPSAVMIRADVAKMASLSFDETMQMGGDYSFYLNMLEHGELAVCHSEGATIKVHPLSAGFKQKLSPIPLLEHIAVTTKYLPTHFNESERQSLLNNLAGRAYGYATICYLRGHRTVAIRMFNLVNALKVSHRKVLWCAVKYLSTELFCRLQRRVFT